MLGKFLEKITSRTSLAEVWAHIRLLQHHKRKKFRSPVLKVDGQYLSSPPAVADSLAQYYSRGGTFSNNQAFSAHKHQSEQQPVVFSGENSAAYNSPFDHNEMMSAISSSKSRSPGPDTIPYTFLQHFTAAQHKHLLSFLNYIYSTGYPHQWREGHIIPILKPSKPATLHSSYRPITLTNCLAKLLGKMVNRRLRLFLESIELFNPNQSGFRASHSTLDGLCRLEHHAHSALLAGRYCVAVFLDITQAFDSVWHHGLLLKLHRLGVSGNLAQFIKQFLFCRKISVRVGSSLSPSYPTHRGVPQGAVLSPTLFSVYINDISSMCLQIFKHLYMQTTVLFGPVTRTYRQQ